MHPTVIMDACHCCGWPLRARDETGARTALDPATLPISGALADDLMTWQDRFDATLNRDDPPASGFPDPPAEDAFWADGLVLAARLAVELIDRNSVTYRDRRYEEADLTPLLGGATRLLGGRIILPSWWRDLSSAPDRHRALLSQFHRELPERHILDGRRVRLLAGCDVCDDVLFHLPDDDASAVVHLTWRKSRETAPQWPWTVLHTDPAALLADLCQRHPWRMTED